MDTKSLGENGISSTANSPLVRLRPRFDALHITRGRTALITSTDGLVNADGEQGLFVHQTRLLSHYRYLIDGKDPLLACLSNVTQHSTLGYYLAHPPHITGSRADAAQHGIEMTLSRFVGEGLHEEVGLTNYTLTPVQFTLLLEVDADFAGQSETRSRREQFGTLEREWLKSAKGNYELTFDYHARHAYTHQEENKTAQLHRGLCLRVVHSASEPSYADGTITFSIALQPHESWHACLDAVAIIEGVELPLEYPCRAFRNPTGTFQRKAESFLEEAASFVTPSSHTLSSVVTRTLEQAKHDLAALRLVDLDETDRAWVPAAGAPTYIALFGRDTLIAGSQSALISPDLMRGSLHLLAKYQAESFNDWRDEQPGRMIHQVQSSPKSVLGYDPLGRYYGTMSAPVFFAETLFEYWIWTGDEAQVRAYLPNAMKAIRWLDRYGDEDGDGFYEFQTRSTQGSKNQCWKDSGESMVYEDGSQVLDPIATCEMQGLAYIAKKHLGYLLHWLGDTAPARKLHDEAEDLRRRFNDDFWMEKEGFFALGKDPKKRLIRSISSDPGACLAAGIVDEALAKRTAERLMAEDMFSGWGVRTLSSHHPAYNPFSYQRGAVWPVENAILALAFVRYGLHEPLQRLARAQFEAASLFDYCRLPEVFSGHPRDPEHPFPVPYIESNSPQAWSASACFCLIQALLGLLPFAPLHLLIVDPHLPDWLPEITLTGIQVGEAKCSLRFFRKGDFTEFEVVDKTGKLHVLRQPSPWSLTAGFGERLKDLASSVFR